MISYLLSVKSIEMKKIQIAAVLLISISISGCFGPAFNYRKSGISNQEKSKDEYQCRRESMYYSGDAYGVHSYSNADIAEACLRARGYVILPFLTPAKNRISVV